MTNQDIVDVASAALLYFTTTGMTEDEEQEFLDFYRGLQDLGEETQDGD